MREQQKAFKRKKIVSLPKIINRIRQSTYVQMYTKKAYNSGKKAKTTTTTKLDRKPGNWYKAAVF